MLPEANVFRHTTHCGLSSLPTLVLVKPEGRYAASHFLCLCFGLVQWSCWASPCDNCGPHGWSYCFKPMSPWMLFFKYHCLVFIPSVYSDQLLHNPWCPMMSMSREIKASINHQQAASRLQEFLPYLLSSYQQSTTKDFLCLLAAVSIVQHFQLVRSYSNKVSHDLKGSLNSTENPFSQ